MNDTELNRIEARMRSAIMAGQSDTVLVDALHAITFLRQREAADKAEADALLVCMQERLGDVI